MGEYRGRVYDIEPTVRIRKPVGVSRLLPLRVIHLVVYVGSGEVKMRISWVDVILSEIYLLYVDIEAFIPTWRLKVIEQG